MRGLLAVCLGGAVGSGLRYLIALAMARGEGRFSFGTLVANVLGCFLMGLIATLGTTQLSPTVRLALTTGLLGGFTTYSTFSLEKMLLAQRGMVLHAAGYAALTLVLGLIGVFAGHGLARAILARGA